MFPIDVIAAVNEEQSIIQEEAMTAEKLAELFRELPSSSSITQETSEEEKTNIMAQLEEAVSAFDAMIENNPEEAAIFEQNFGQLYLAAMDLNDALTGNESEVYAHYPYTQNSNKNITITVENINRNRVSGATITVIDNRGNTYEVSEQWNGQYKFTRSDRNYDYTITVSAVGYQTASVTIKGSQTSTTVTLEEVVDVTGENWQNFNVYYISTGKLPNSYAGAGDASDYGPSGNNTPLVTIRVDVNKLIREYSDVVKYERNNGNQWHYIPVGAAKDLEATTRFWNAVKACMDESSIQAFEDTGLYGHCVIYVLKKQNDGSQHADGILNVTPPVYVLEYYDRGSYFGGSATDQEGTFKTIEDIQIAYENHLKVDITWNADKLSGVYQTSDNVYTITITQNNSGSAVAVPGSEIKYNKITNEYYLAAFNCTISEGAAGYHTVKYTDGITSTTLFADQNYVVTTGSHVPAFEGDPKNKYPGHHFDGWALDGGDGKLYSTAEVTAMTVQNNMVFHAQWSRVPTEFEATINVVLNDNYAADIKTMFGNSNTKLFVSADGSTFYELENTAVGEYKANIPNGTYYTYYSTDNSANHTRIDDRGFEIASAEGGRKVKFYSVSYDLSGGSSDPEIPAINYYHAGTAVQASSVIPHKKEYVFKGWKNSNGTVYASGDLLADKIATFYTLTAQWEKAIDVNVTVVIEHGNDTTDKNDEVTFSLVEVRSGITIHTGLTKSLSETNRDGYDFNEDSVNQKIIYTPSKVTFEDLPKADYTLNCFKAGYEVKVEKTESDGVQHITLTLTYKPEDFVLDFDVKMDVSARENPELWPQAVRVKAIRWEDDGWVVVPQHKNTSVLVAIDKNSGTGSGHVNVPQHWPGMENQAADYRVIITAYIMPDGKTVSASQVPGGKYASTNGIYESVVTIENGGRIPSYPKTAEIKAAYYDAGQSVQNGTPTATVFINSYNVTFKANTISGGKVENKDSHVVEKQIKIPEFAGYVLTPPAEGYVFEGWYSQDGTSSGNWGEKIVAGTGLSSDLIVYAKWKAPLAIKGNVYVAGSYIGEGGTEIAIYEHDRIDTVTIVLRKKGVGGNIKSVQVPVTYSSNLGSGTYTFEYLPNDGSEYYIEVISSNYSGYFQNEPESRTNPEDYSSYTKEDNDAVFGDIEPSIATVNAYLKFDPASFDVQFQVNATAISESFRPEEAEVLITYNDGKIVTDPSRWTVISQMIHGGDKIILADGMGNGSTSVWNGFHDGATLYEYGMRVANVEGLGTYTGSELPYHIEYQDPAYYVPGGQSKLLKATLIPNKYAINYELGIESTAVVGMTNAPKEHTWSYETAISVKPVRSGYEFLGWYDNDAFTGEPVTKIEAGVSEETTLYAKWLQVQDKVNLTVNIIHKAENGDGLASNYDKDLLVQLTHSQKGSAHPYEAVTGKVRKFDGSQWHTMDDGVEEEIFAVNSIYTNLSSAYAYSLNVSLDDYIVTKKEVNPIYDDESGITTYDVQVTLQFVPDLLNLTVYAEIAEGIGEELWPISAEVAINCWYDHPNESIGLKWNTISQHEKTTLTLYFDQTGIGSVKYPVWQWYDKEHNIPYYYRMEVMSLHLKNGTIVDMSGNGERYTGGDYLADIKTDAFCQTPDNPAGTSLPGAYGETVIGGGYSQKGTVKAVISTDIWGDNTPDHMQAEIRFCSADESRGTVSGNLSQIFTLDPSEGSYSKNVTPESVSLSPVEGYEFSHWTDGKGNIIVNPFMNQNVFGGKTYTYTAHWKPLTNLIYTVQYLDMSGAQIRTTKEAVGQTFGHKIKSADEIVKIEGYVFDHADKSEIVIGVTPADNVIKLYYAKDNNDDDIADYKQAFVKFQSADAKGTVSGKTAQVFTFSADSGYRGTVNPENVILTAVEGYKFLHWTNENGDGVGNPFVSQFYEGGKTYTYTAHWTERTDYVYRVKYLNKENNQSLKPDKVVENQTFNAAVEETALVIDGYVLDGPSVQSFTIDAEDKVIVFYYNIRKDLKLTVKYREWGGDPSVALHPDTVSTGMKFGDQPNMEVLKVDIYGYTYHSTTPGTISIGTGENLVTVYYTKQNCNYRVEYYYDDVIDNGATVTGTVPYGSVINTYTDKPKTGYTFDYVAGKPLTVDVKEDFNVIRVHYATDGNDNDIPDKYEATITFKVINGKWTSYKGSAMNSVADVVATYPMYERDTDGSWKKIDTVKIGHVPVGAANTGYTGGTWMPSVNADTAVTGDAVYTLGFSIDKYTIVATVVNGSAKLSGSDFSYTEVTHSDTDTTTIHFEPTDNSYVVDIVRVDGVNATLDANNTYTFDHKSNHQIFVTYEKDMNGDKIPDKYQKKVSFLVVNGTWGNTNVTEVVEYLELMKDGKYDPDGTATFTAPSNMEPAVGLGYIADGSKWDVTPPSTFSGTHEETYVYRYTQKEQITIKIDVQGGTSYPVHSSTIYDYDNHSHVIEFAPNAGYVLDIARIKRGDISEAGTWENIVWNEIDSNGKTKYSHDHTVNQHIQVVYAKDSNGDNIADYKQVFIHFDSAANGSVSGAVDQIYDKASFASGFITPAAVDKSASTGYVFSHWKDRDGNKIADPIGNISVIGGETYTFTAIWIPRSDLSYTVKYVDEAGNEIHSKKTKTNMVFGTEVSAESEKIDISDYVFISADKEKLTIDVSDNVLTLTYGRDVWKDTPEGNDKENGGDDYPDSKQALIRFSSANEQKGTVTGKEVIQVFTINDGNSKVIVPAQVGLHPEAGYQFSHWTIKGQSDSINPYEPMTILGNMVKEYVAHWTERVDLSYTVNHFDLNGQRIDDAELKTGQTYGAVIKCDEHKKTIPGYVFDHAELDNITIDVGANIVNLYYAKDDNNDKIADYKQFFVHFVSDDETMGIVDHHITQVFNLEKNSSGDYAAKVTPLRTDDKNSSGVVVITKAGYVEDYWTRGGENTPVNPFVPMDAEGGTEVTFVVHFAADNDNTGYADKYEATVTYKIHQGFWNNGKDHTDKTETFLLYMQNEDTGWTLISPAVTLGGKIPNIDSVIPDSDNGFKAPGYWGNKLDATDDPLSTTEVVDGAVYTYHFSELIDYTITVNVVNGGFKANGNVEASPITVRFNDDLELEFEAKQENGKNYALESVTVDGVAASLDADGKYSFEDIRANHSVTVVYGEDVWSDPVRDTNPEIPGDGIADSFQVKVNYHAIPEEFGSVSSAYEVHTIVDANGVPIKQGTVKLHGVEARVKSADDSGIYTFVNWTDSITSYALRASGSVISTKALLKLELENVNGGSEYHYYANFRYNMKMAAVYFVEHYLWNNSQGKYVLDDKATFMGRAYVGDEVDAQPVKFTGYVLNTSKSDMKGLVTEPVADPTTMAPTNVLTLKLYYDVEAKKEEQDNNGGSSGSSSGSSSGNTSNNTNNTSESTLEAVKTGDTSNIGLWFSMLCASVVGLLGLFARKRKTE